MKIKNQKFEITDTEFDFSIDSDFEVEIRLDQPCFFNCNLVVTGCIDADDGLFPCCHKYVIKTELGGELEVDLDPKLQCKIESDIDAVFYEKYEKYCEDVQQGFFEDFFHE